MSDIPPAIPPAAPPATGAPATPPQEPPSTPPPAAPATPPAEPTPQGDPAALGDPGKRALDAEREARKTAETELQQLRAQVKEAEDKEKSELELLQETAKGLQGTATDHAKLRAAMAKAPAGTTPSQILGLYQRLQGTTTEELEADAEKFFAQFTGSTPPASPPAQQTGPGLPVETLQPGAPQVGAGPGLQEQIQAAEAKQDWATARRLKSQMTVEAMTRPPSS